MSKFISFLLVCLMCVVGSAYADHLPDVLHDESNVITKKANNKKQNDKKYRQQQLKVSAAYKQYKKKVAKVWGNDAVVPSAKRDVTYRDNLKQRSVVDYEGGLVKVELALKKGSEAETASAIERLEAAIEKTILQGTDNRSIVEIAKNPEPPSLDHKNGMPQSELASLLANGDDLPFSLEDLEDFKKEYAKNAQTRQLRGRDGVTRIIFSTQLKLVPNHIRVRAEKFRDTVDHYAYEHKIPAPLIFAIIETESSFNPRAKSPVPAFGLMQLVPRSAARDAYKFLYSKDKIIKEKYLYDPDNNVQLGVAYLHLLYYKYFKNIKDPESRKWATVAAYNAGARNVIKAMSGRYSKKKYKSSYVWKRDAFKKLNSMDSDQVFTYLNKRMPAGETRRYIKKVRNRMDKYRV